MGKLIEVPFSRWFAKRDSDRSRFVVGENLLKQARLDYLNKLITYSEYDRRIDVICDYYNLIRLDTSA